MQKDTKLISHDAGQYAEKNGIRAHSMYVGPVTDHNYPFIRLSRWHFAKPGHHYFLCHIKDIYDPKTIFYAFTHKPVKGFNSCSVSGPSA